jgi:hypothetical protein
MSLEISPEDYERWAERRCQWLRQWHELGGTVRAQLNEQGAICGVEIFAPDRDALDAKQKYALLCLQRSYAWEDVAFALERNGLAPVPGEGGGGVQ